MNVDWPVLLRALALVMVIEGLLPFVAPSQWRRVLFTIAQMDNRTMRLIGLGSMAAGIIMLQFV